MNKNLTIRYFNCDSLQFHFLKNIWRVLFLTNDVLINRREYEDTSCDTDLDINDCLQILNALHFMVINNGNFLTYMILYSKHQKKFSDKLPKQN